MSGRPVAAAAALVSVLAGCAGAQPVRLRWADQSTPLVQTVVPTLSVSSIEASGPGAAKIRDMAERSAAAYIDALAGKISEPDAFRAAVAGGIAPGKASDADQTKLSRTLAIGIGKRGYQAGHRFLAARVVIEPIGFEFADLTQVTSRYSSINLETVSVQSTTTAKVGIAPEFGNVIEAAEASLSREEKAGTTYVNQARVEALTADFQPDRITIYQQSAPNEDLTGLVLASVSVRPVALDDAAKAALATRLGVPTSELDFNVDQSSPQTVVAQLKLSDEAGRQLAPDKASITTVVNQAWTPRPLRVCAAMSYVERVPSTATARFYDEGRQIVTERADALPGRLFTLVPASDVAKPLWGIVAGPSYLEIDTPAGHSPFSFTDPIQASRFASWMAETRATRVGEKRLWALGDDGKLRQLSAGAGGAVRVERIELTRSATPVPGTCTIAEIERDRPGQPGTTR